MVVKSLWKRQRDKERQSASLRQRLGRKLMNTVVSFSGASRRCLRWVEKEAQLLCTQCQCWGHLNYNCLSNVMRCSKCAGPHDYRQHDRFCEMCKSGKGRLCIPKCHNCWGPHFSNSKDCVFYLSRSSKERQVQLRDEFSQKWKEEAAALKATANSDSGRAARSAIASKLSSAGGKNQIAQGKAKGPVSGKGRVDDGDDDYVPVGKGGKAKYTFGGMAKGLASTTRIEEVASDDNEHGNDGDGKAGEHSDTYSDLHLSYLDNVPLKTRFPDLKPPVSTSATAGLKPPQREKPLTITLPALGSGKPLRSVTDVLRELKTPVKETPQARFGGGEVAYSASAMQSEAIAFATALADAGIPSQPSPPSAPAAPTSPSRPALQPASDHGLPASIPQPPTKSNV